MNDAISRDKNIDLSYRNIFFLSLPSMAAVGLEPVAELIDTAFLGQVSSEWVASLASTNSFVLTFVWIFNFLSSGVSAHVARSLGACEQEKARHFMAIYIAIALVLGGVIGSCLLFFQDFSMRVILGSSEEIIDTARPYWFYRCLGYPAVLLSLPLLGILRGLQKIPFTLLIMSIVTGLNMIGTYVFVFVFQQGVGGAALATTISFVVGDVIALYWLWKNSWIVFRKDFFFFPHDYLKIVRKDGGNIMGRTLMLAAAFFLMAAAASRLGVYALAAHQIALQYWLVASFVVDGYAITATSVGGYYLGRGHKEVFSKLGSTLLRLGLLTGVFFLIIYGLGFLKIAAFFTKESLVHKELYTLIGIMMLSQPLNALLYVLDGLLFGAAQFQYMKKRMQEGFICFFLPLLLIGYYYAPSLVVIWLALLAFNLYRLLSNYKRYCGVVNA